LEDLVQNFTYNHTRTDAIKHSTDKSTDYHKYAKLTQTGAHAKSKKNTAADEPEHRINQEHDNISTAAKHAEQIIQSSDCRTSDKRNSCLCELCGNRKLHAI
jgi:hypothetical protein